MNVAYIFTIYGSFISARNPAATKPRREVWATGLTIATAPAAVRSARSQPQAASARSEDRTTATAPFSTLGLWSDGQPRPCRRKRRMAAGHSNHAPRTTGFPWSLTTALNAIVGGMKDVLILGGGFAGVWSAAGAVRLAREVGDDELRVRLISAGDDMVVRPRLYERNPDKMRISLDSLLGPIGVNRINARVESIDVDAQTVTARGHDGAPVTATYDRLVLATGSQLNRPTFPGSSHAFDIDTLEAATALDAHLHHLPKRNAAGQYTAVVVGAGFTGLEIATELAGRLRDIAGDHDVRVILVERAQVPGPELGDAPRPFIIDALDELNVELRLGRTLVSATADQVTLDDGEVIPAATLVWTVGMAASPLTAQIPGERDRFGRLIVDEYLRVTPTVYAAGDTAAASADHGHPTIQSCQHAQPMGKYAGYNVAADLLGLPMLPFTADPYSNCIDLGAAGALMTVGWDRIVEKAGPEAKAMKHAINTQWIYPPADSADALLAKAGHFSNSA